MTRGRVWQTVLVAAGIFALMYALNHLMPLHRDDYDYSLIWQTGRHIASLSDVMESLQRHYLLHGGRMPAFFFLDVFLLLGKGIFDVANALMFLVFVVLLTIHARRDGRFWQEPGIFAVMGILAWLSFPHFGEVAVWKCGAAVYLWTGVIVALFLVPYNLHFKKIDKSDMPTRHWLIAPMFALGVGGLVGGEPCRDGVRIGGGTFLAGETQGRPAPLDAGGGFRRTRRTRAARGGAWQFRTLRRAGKRQRNSHPHR